MRRTLGRGAALIYVAILWLAVWPFPSVPILGPAQRGAEDALLFFGLRPGMAVFPGIEDEFYSRTACTTVLGRRDRQWDTLYQSECPPEGSYFFRSSFDTTLSRMQRTNKRPLLRESFPELRGAPEAVRHTIELMDYFCHADGERDRVVLRWVQHLRSVRDGSFPPLEHHLVCTWDCDPDGRPSCLLRPFEAEASQ